MNTDILYNLFCDACKVKIDELNAKTKKRDLYNKRKIAKAREAICKKCQERIKEEIFKNGG